ncbi:MAG: response regulator SirA [Candidatus Eisenbacteria bacterium]|nr:response regulator SirA [Candidatus Eisenbacteria bacterium]
MSERQNPEIADTLDMIGQFCPEPVIRTNEAVEALDPGQVLEVLADDPSSRSDIESWARRTGNELVSVDETEGTFRFLIRRR